MTIDTETYQRVRAQVIFLMNIVELLASSIDRESGAAKSARRAVDLVQRAISATELAADVYASVATDIEDVFQQVQRLKAEARPASSVEWEALRSGMEQASARISVAALAGPA